jgi:hypothetical protein
MSKAQRSLGGVVKRMMTKTLAEIIKLCEALSNRHRLRIIAALSEKKEKE